VGSVERTPGLWQEDLHHRDAYLWAYMSDNPYSLPAQSDEDADES
jgi:hypothetical protein